MHEARADAIVVGAGPNGLVAANLLADHGWDVLVLEAAASPGGAVRSAELIEPGFTNDRCSAFYPFAPVSPIEALGLEDHGLRWLRAPLVLAHPARDGSCPVLSEDLEETASSLEALHPGDGRAWMEMYGEWRRVREPLLRSLLGPFPPVRGGARLALTLRRDLLRFARMMLLPVRRLGEERFGGEAARRWLAAAALHADFGPESAAGGVFGWLLLMLGQDHGYPVPEGGAGRLTDAMVSRLRSRGGEVLSGHRVDSVVVAGGRAVGVTVGGSRFHAERAVLADLDAPTLFHRLVGDDRLPPRFVDDLRRFQWDHSTVKVDWTLDAPVPWTAPEARRAGTVHLAESVDALTEVHSQTTRRLLPAHPLLLVGQQSMTDPTRQPVGRETLWAYTHVPHRIEGDAGGDIGDVRCRDQLERFANRIEAEVEAHAPGFRDLVRGRHAAGPVELEADDPALVDGAISGGTSQIHQMLVFRPVPGTGRPTTPIDGLYLASSSAHPGGAVHGSPGANAARAALWHHRGRAGLAAIRRRTTSRGAPA